MTRILILGGTAEAVALAKGIAEGAPGVDVVTSLAGILDETPDLPGRLRRGGFGGADGLARYLGDERIDALVDATHPFARIMAATACTAACRSGVPRIKLVRPMWNRMPGDCWIVVDDLDAAVDALKTLAPPAALITLGSRAVDSFRRIDGVQLIFRMIAPPKEPLAKPAMEVLLQRGPFDVQRERALMTDRRIGALVTRASGGRATEAKIRAARDLHLPVIMIRRPAIPEGPVAATAEGVLAWLRERGFAG
ncbi:MAG: cobalt-precorrin-6A reductase [bacterium]|nr:cobalt-precorrin-6A reductase [bacterium]